MTITRFRNAAPQRIALAALMFSAAPFLNAATPGDTGYVEVTGIFGSTAHLPDLSPGLQDGLTQVLGSGFTVSSGSAFKWYAGGSFGFAIPGNLIVVGETNYNHAWGANVSYNSGGSSFNFSERLGLTDYTGGLHWQIPGGNKKFRPYIGGAAGMVRETAKASAAGIPAISASAISSTYNVGGGVRLHLHGPWGIRPEVKWVHIPGQNYVRYGVGFYWRSRS